MDNQMRNSPRSMFNSQRISRQPSDESQRPLIDVARSYCSTFTSPMSSRVNASATPQPLMTKQDGDMKENQSQKPRPPRMAYYPNTGQVNPFTWRAKSDSATPPHVPVRPAPSDSGSKSKSPYSWKASPMSPLSRASHYSDSNSPSGSVPRSVKMSSPNLSAKFEPLTITIGNESDVTLRGPSAVPLQPFSPTGNSTECTCHRSPKIILCQSCGEFQKGRLSMACARHPRKVFLMDINCCASCKSTNLKEILDA